MQVIAVQPNWCTITFQNGVERHDVTLPLHTTAVQQKCEGRLAVCCKHAGSGYKFQVRACIEGGPVLRIKRSVQVQTVGREMLCRLPVWALREGLPPACHHAIWPWCLRTYLVGDQRTERTTHDTVALLGEGATECVVRATSTLNEAKVHAVAVLFEKQRAENVLSFFAERAGTPVLNTADHERYRDESEALWFSALLPYCTCVRALLDDAVGLVLAVWRLSLGLPEVPATATRAADSLWLWHQVAVGKRAPSRHAEALLLHLAPNVRSVIVPDTLITIANIMHVRGSISSDPTPSFPVFTVQHICTVSEAALDRELGMRGLAAAGRSLEQKRDKLRADMLADPFAFCHVAWKELKILRGALRRDGGCQELHTALSIFFERCRVRCASDMCAQPLHGALPSVKLLTSPALDFVDAVRKACPAPSTLGHKRRMGR